jgi:cytochrome c553
LDFRDGKRSATVMTRLAKGYSDTDIDALAKYIATLK